MTKTSSENGDIILVVEDTEVNYDVIKTFLNDIDVECENAFDGMQAVTMCSTVPTNYYSLILMDINLPRMDGFETTNKLRAMGVECPIIAVTAISKEETAMKKADRVFDSVLFKPFNYLELYAVISTYIKNAMSYTLNLEETFNDGNEFLAVDIDVCNIYKAVSNMGNSPRLFVKHFNNFKSNNVDLVPRLRKMLEEHCYSEAEMLCHSIKGISGMLALQMLYSDIIELELCFRKAANAVSSRSPVETTDAPCNIAHIEDEISGILAVVSNDVRRICQVQF